MNAVKSGLPCSGLCHQAARRREGATPSMRSDPRRGDDDGLAGLLVMVFSEAQDSVTAVAVVRLGVTPDPVTIVGLIAPE